MGSTNLTCDEILKLIRASKSYNLNYIKCGDLVISRNGVEPAPKEKVAIPVNENDEQAALQEIQAFEDENLMISDPEEYERRVGS